MYLCRPESFGRASSRGEPGLNVWRGSIAKGDHRMFGEARLVSNLEALIMFVRFGTTLVATLGFVAVTVSSAVAGPVGPSVETLTVSSSGDLTTSSMVLQNGVQYYLLAEGTYNIGNSPHWADAEWITPDNWVTWDEIAVGQPPPIDGLLGDILVDGTAFDWRGHPLVDPDSIADFAEFLPHTYSPSHEYWIGLVGTGEQIELAIYDTAHFDNEGSLTVSIFITPEPATVSLLALGGLLAIRRRR